MTLSMLPSLDQHELDNLISYALTLTPIFNPICETTPNRRCLHEKRIRFNPTTPIARGACLLLIPIVRNLHPFFQNVCYNTPCPVADEIAFFKPVSLLHAEWHMSKQERMFLFIDHCSLLSGSLENGIFAFNVNHRCEVENCKACDCQSFHREHAFVPSFPISSRSC